MKTYFTLAWTALVCVITNGCVMTEQFAEVAQKLPEPPKVVRAAKHSIVGETTIIGCPTAMAVIAEPKTAQQAGQVINGLVVQVVLTDVEERMVSAEGKIVFSIYRDEMVNASTVEADRQWTFDSDDIAKARAHRPMGVVHNFWLPLDGDLATASYLKLFSAYRSPTGQAIGQWNKIATLPAKVSVYHAVNKPKANKSSQGTPASKSN